MKIADFGISKRDVEATALRTIAGTPQFLAPEVSGFQTSDTYTSAVDIWALGAITYTLLTGEPLFKDMGLLYQYAAGSMPFPTGALDTKGVSKEAIAFLTSMVAAKPDDRPQARACLCDPWIGRSEDLPTIQSQRLVIRILQVIWLTLCFCL